MEFSLLVAITILNCLSLLVFFMINRETKRVVESHVELIRKVNATLVETTALKIGRLAYFIILTLLIGFSYVLYIFWIS